MSRILKYAMIGGGPGSFIGGAHRRAIGIDRRAELVCGCFSRDPAKSLQMADELHLDPARCYATVDELLAAEAGEIDFAVIVTPNDSHYAIAKACLEAGVNVSCDKPVTVSLAQATELRDLSREKDLLFMVTYTYTGHVTAKYMRDLIRRGDIGEVRMVMAEYPQGWLAFADDDGGKQGAWRIDPKRSGGVNCLGDLGTHVENFISMATGLKIRRLLAKLDIVVPGRVLDDNDSVLVEYDNGASGIYWTSQVAIGCDNSLRIRIYGSKGSIEWFQEIPDRITVIDADGTIREVHRGYGQITPDAAKYGRLPSGHTEGWLEAMGNLYISFADCLLAKENGTFTPDMIDFETVDAGVEGLAFVEACLKSTNNGNIWVEPEA